MTDLDKLDAPEKLTIAEQRAEREAARLMAAHSCPQCRRVEARKRRAREAVR